MKKDIRILGLVEEVHYHEVQGSLERMTLTPERDAIFRYMSQIGYEAFPRFIKDILVQVYGHTLVDVTDGAGDEGQDILTMIDGKRCLTQCKHTENFKEHYNGNESDKLFSSCFRKNCQMGILVTNTDLTIQAKRYFTDREYARSTTFEKVPELDYWNGSKIWDAISKSNSILNKWFSGMAQAHGLRKFRFSLVSQLCPDGKTSNWVEYIQTEISKVLKEYSEDLSISISEKNEFSFKMSTWFSSDMNLGVPYIVHSEPDGSNVPLYALEIDVDVSKNVQQFSPEEIITLIVQYIADFLPEVKADNWWHIVATPAQGTVFFQETNSPSTIEISRALRFVKFTNQKLCSEDEWLEIHNKSFLESQKGEFDWKYNLINDCDICLLVSTKQNHFFSYQQYLITKSQVERMKAYKFLFVQNPSVEVRERIRHLVAPFMWPVLLSSSGDLFWGHPVEDDEIHKRKVVQVLERQKIIVKAISSHGRDKILERVEVAPLAASYFASKKEDIFFPVLLGQRVLQVSLKVNFNFEDSVEVLAELLMFKFNFEVRHGFDAGKGRANLTLASEEIKGRLFDLFSFRGNKMLDMILSKKELTIFLRAYLTEGTKLEEDAVTIISEIQQIASDIEKELRDKVVGQNL